MEEWGGRIKSEWRGELDFLVSAVKTENIKNTIKSSPHFSFAIHESEKYSEYDNVALIRCKKAWFDDCRVEI